MLGALENAEPIVSLRESYLVYPVVNTVHVIGIALLFGAIVPLDLRLIGWRRDAAPAVGVAKLLLPVAISGLVLAIPAGLLLFATDARAYAGSPLFQAKMLIVALAISNAVWLRASERRGAVRERRAALAAAASIMLWLSVIVLGRLLGYS